MAVILIVVVSQSDPRKTVFICQSTKSISVDMLLDTSEADIIYYKQVDSGIIYVLMFKKIPKKHSYVETKI